MKNKLFRIQGTLRFAIEKKSTFIDEIIPVQDLYYFMITETVNKMNCIISYDVAGTSTEIVTPEAYQIPDSLMNSFENENFLKCWFIPGRTCIFINRRYFKKVTSKNNETICITFYKLEPNYNFFELNLTAHSMSGFGTNTREFLDKIEKELLELE